MVISPSGERERGKDARCEERVRDERNGRDGDAPSAPVVTSASNFPGAARGGGARAGVCEDNADREKTERSALKVRARA